MGRTSGAATSSRRDAPGPDLVLRSPVGDQSLTRLVAAIIAVGMAAAIVFHLVVALAFDADYPWNTFLYDPSYRFSDFWDVYDQAKTFGPGSSDNMVYSPLLHLVARGLALLPVQLAFGLVVAVFVAALGAVAWRWTTATVSPLHTRIIAAAVLALVPYPVAFVIDRGNLDMLVFAVLAAFFWLYWERSSSWAFLPLGLAIAAKYFWVTLLIIFVCDRRFRQLMWAIVVAVASTLIAALVIGWTSGFGVGRVFGNLMSTLGGHVDNAAVLPAAHYGHTIWGVLLIVDRWTFYRLSDVLDLRLLYMACVVLAFVWIASYLLRRDYEPWRLAGSLVALTLLFPYESHDYTLVFLLLPLALFLTAERRSRRTLAASVLFGMLLVPLHYYNLVFWGHVTDVSISVLVYPALLIALVAVMLRRPAPAVACVDEAAVVAGDRREARGDA